MSFFITDGAHSFTVLCPPVFPTADDEALCAERSLRRSARLGGRRSAVPPRRAAVPCPAGFGLLAAAPRGGRSGCGRPALRGRGGTAPQACRGDVTAPLCRSARRTEPPPALALRPGPAMPSDRPFKQRRAFGEPRPGPEPWGRLRGGRPGGAWPRCPVTRGGRRPPGERGRGWG